MGSISIVLLTVFIIFFFGKYNFSSKVLLLIGYICVINDIYYSFQFKYLINGKEQLFIICAVIILGIVYKIKNKNYIKEKNIVIFINFLILMFFISDILSSYLGLHNGFYIEGIYLFLIVFSIYINVEINCKEIIFVVTHICKLYMYCSIILLIFKPARAIMDNYNYSYMGIPFRYSGITEHANGFGIILSILLIMLIVFKESRALKINILITFISLIFTQSKTNYLIVIITLLILFIIKNRKKIIVNFINLILINSFVSIVGISIITGKMKELTFSGRLFLWRKCIGIWKKSKIFGYGPYFLNIEHRTQLFGKDTPFGHAHNQFIQTLCQNGIFGFLILIAFMFTIIFVLKKYRSVLTCISNEYKLLMIFFVNISIRMISECPLKIYSININLFIVLILIGSLISCCRKLGGEHGASNYFNMS